MRARHVVGAIALVALAGCSNHPAPTEPTNQQVAALESAAAAQAALPACSEVFVPGKVVAEKAAMAGCLSKRGQLQAIGFFECQDGGILFQVEASTGAPNGFGFGGKPYRVVKGDAAADPGYKKAYQACQSDKPAKAKTRKEPTVGAIKVGAGVEVTAGASGVQVSVSGTPATPDVPETQVPVPDQVPVPGGEWRSRPSPTPTSTEDPA